MGTVEWIVLMSVGVLAGLGLGFFLGRLDGRGNSQKLADVEAELEEYRQNVSEHFSASAEHFQAIGRQYRELYEHMAAGSEKLCVGAPSEGQLKFPRPDEVSKETYEKADEPLQSADAAAEQASETDEATVVSDSESGDADTPVQEHSASESLTSETQDEDAVSGEAASEHEASDRKSGDGRAG